MKLLQHFFCLQEQLNLIVPMFHVPIIRIDGFLSKLKLTRIKAAAAIFRGFSQINLLFFISDSYGGNLGNSLQYDSVINLLNVSQIGFWLINNSKVYFFYQRFQWMLIFHFPNFITILKAICPVTFTNLSWNIISFAQAVNE